MSNKIESFLSDRNITSLDYLYVKNKELSCSGEVFSHILDNSIASDGGVSIEQDCVKTVVNGGVSSYQLRFNFPEKLNSEGFFVTYCLNGWEAIRYLAIGFREEGNFYHIKINNPSQSEWVDFSVAFSDVICSLNSNFANNDSYDVNNLIVYVSGKPKNEGASISCKKIGLFNCNDEILSDWLKGEQNSRIRKELVRYFNNCNPKLDAQVENFLKKTVCPMSGSVELDWKIDDYRPSSLLDSGTYRYLWHGLHPATSLMVDYLKNDHLNSLFFARDLIQSWLENSFFNKDSDKKYTWYDHGVAERTLSLILMHDIGLELSFDYRFMSRLRYAIQAHARLLESEAFYASHQKDRYHNHAWFQDIALIALAMAYPNLRPSSKWLERGVSRLTDQFNKLIVRDNGFAIFVENSIGYHHGVQRLVDFAGNLIAISGVKSDISEVSKELVNWSNFFRYPDGRAPSQGDTYRRINSVAKSFKGKPYTEKSCVSLFKAGYVVQKSNHDDIPFMLICYATSLSATHKHEDNLSINLFYDGIEWLIDPSMYSHDYSDPIPSFLRSAVAHNNVFFLDKSYCIEARKAKFVSSGIDDSLFSFVGIHSSYEDIKLKRKVESKLDKLEFSCIDHFSTSLSNEGLKPFLGFHFGEGVKIQKYGDGFKLSHHLSDRNLLLQIDDFSECTMSSGFTDEKLPSFSGAGFEEVQETSSLYISMNKNEITWNIKVLS
jgi:hypothetical protein